MGLNQGNTAAGVSEAPTDEFGEKKEPSAFFGVGGRSGKKKKRKDKKEEKSAPPIVGATALLAAKYPSYLAESNDTRSKTESRAVLLVVASIIGLVTFIWVQWGLIHYQIGKDFAYNMGLTGGILMIIALIYALRKRLKIMRKAGSIETWYYIHLVGGVVGPILIIIHTAFAFKSVNSIVALVAMLFVVGSGLFGRYIYTRIGYGLHKKLIAIKNTETAFVESLRNYQSDAVEIIERRLSEFALASLAGPRSILKFPIRFFAIRTAAAKCYVIVGEELTKMLHAHGVEEQWREKDLRIKIAEEKTFLRHHINAVVDIAHVHLYERLLVRWRILHIPLLYILTITVLIHVLAVHMY